MTDRVDERCAFFIGRFQPLHAGHRALIQVALDEGKRVVVALMDTARDAGNPYSLEDRRAMFAEVFGDAVELISIPPVGEVCYGRNVGYRLRRIHLAPEIEAINATAIRESSDNINHNEHNVHNARQRRDGGNGKEPITDH